MKIYKGFIFNFKINCLQINNAKMKDISCHKNRHYRHP